MQASAGRSLAASRIARAISIHRMPLSLSFKFAGDGEALPDTLDLAISLCCVSIHSRISSSQQGPQSYEHASGQASVELGLRHAILHRSGKTAARPGAIRRRSDWSPVTPSLSQPGSHFMLRHASCPCLLQSPKDASCHFRGHRLLLSLYAALLVPMVVVMLELPAAEEDLSALRT